MTGLRSQYQKAPVHPERVYAISPARAYASLLSTVATSEFQSSITGKFHMVTWSLDGVFCIMLLICFSTISMFCNLKRKRESKKD